MVRPAEAIPEDIDTLAGLISDRKVAMLTTALPDGTLHTRPMVTQRKRFDGTLWFFTDRGSDKTHEIQAHQNVNLAYCDEDSQTYVSVSGLGQIVDDRQMARELWTPAHKAWFPDGPDDPRLVLLAVHVQSAQYWKGPPSKVVQLLGFAKAVATGKRYRPGKTRAVDMPAEPPAATRKRR